jgi:hypothetical protein
MVTGCAVTQARSRDVDDTPLKNGLNLEDGLRPMMSKSHCISVSQVI